MHSSFYQKQEKTQSDIVQEFRDYLDADWIRWMIEYPECATSMGFTGQDQRWIDNSPEGIARRKQHLQQSLAGLKKIQRAMLPEAEQFNYDIYLELLETASEGLQYGSDPWPFRYVFPENLWMPLTQLSGIQQGAANIINSMSHQTVADYENILARLTALPTLVEQNIRLLQEGLKLGYTPPALTLRDVPEQIAGLVPEGPMTSELLKPLTEFPTDIPEDQRIRLLAAAKLSYTQFIRPAYLKLHDYVANTYLPACRQSISTSDLPNGKAAYEHLMRWHTTTSLTVPEIHQLGLAEVKRVRAEMEKVMVTTGFEGDFKKFTEFLRTDPRFYYSKPDELVDAYRVIAKNIDPELPRLFGKLPRLPYGIKKIPDFSAPSQTTAYYDAGSPQAGRPGWYFVNTYNLAARPKWEMEVLSAHEAVPGHHLQISLAQEKENIPAFRKHLGYSAYVEGWALYAESLGEKLGLYKDPYSKFGQLSYEMWRAVRLVVDTGIHAMGWTRDQAIQYFKDNSSKTDQDITVEVDRYIAIPAQALAYKIGQLKLLELRKEAEKRDGEKFDIRQFHYAVLEQGAVPLSILEKLMNQEQSALTSKSSKKFT